MNQFGSGESVICQYADDDQPELWQERLLLAPVGLSGLHWIAMTPDGDMEFLDLETVSAFRPLLAQRRLPRGVREQDAYLIYFAGRATGFYSGPELKDLTEEAERTAILYAGRAPPRPPPVERRHSTKGPEVASPGTKAKQPPPASPVLVRGGAAATATSPILPTAAAVAVPKGQWYAMESAGGHMLGAAIRAPHLPTDVVRGGRALLNTGPDQFVVAKLLTDTEAISEFSHISPPAASGDTLDARCLKIQYVGGRRHRDFSSLVDDCFEEDFTDFPLVGPRTVAWCLAFMRRRRHPTDHHALWKTVAKLSGDSWGVAEHENLAHLLTLSAEYDQLDLCNCAWAEAALRRMQTIEWVYHDKVKEQEQGAGDRISVEELAAFSGTHKAGETIMICPSLLSHVRSQVETDVGIMKSVRKAREERDLRKKKKPGKGPGKGEGDG